MPIGLLFWMLMILALIAQIGAEYGWFGARAWLGGVFLWFLLFLLGWHDFGFILQGR